MSCSVWRPANAVQELRTYRVSGVMLTGESRYDLSMALDGVFITSMEPFDVKEDLNNEFTAFNLSVKLNDEAALNRLVGRLRFAGFQVSRAVLQDQ
jgi:hypothetical protein